MAYYKKTPEREKIMNEIRDMVKEINKRYEAARGDAVSADFWHNQIVRFKGLTKTTSEKKFRGGSLSHMSMKKLTKLHETASKTIASQYSTLEGAHKIRDKQLATLRARGVDLTDDEFEKFYKLMNDSTIKELLESRVLDSEQILNDVVSSASLRSTINAATLVQEAFGLKLNTANSAVTAQIIVAAANMIEDGISTYDVYDALSSLHSLDLNSMSLGEDAEELMRDIVAGDIGSELYKEYFS